MAKAYPTRHNLRLPTDNLDSQPPQPLALRVVLGAKGKGVPYEPERQSSNARVHEVFEQHLNMCEVFEQHLNMREVFEQHLNTRVAAGVGTLKDRFSLLVCVPVDGGGGAYPRATATERQCTRPYGFRASRVSSQRQECNS